MVKALKTPDPEPQTGEIFTSDLAYSFMAFAYGQINVNVDNPSAIWDRLRWDPWFSIPVYRDIEEKDDMVSSCLETRKDAVLSKKRRVLPASDKLRDKKVADFVEETLESYWNPDSQNDGVRFGIEHALFEMMDATGKGASIAEIIWGNAPDRVYVDHLKFKPQHLFAFGEGQLGSWWTASYLLPQDGPLRIRTGIVLPNVPEMGGVLPSRKFVVHTHRPQYSNRWGTPLIRRVFWLSSFKRAAIKAWLKFLEKGTGSVLAKYRDGATEDEINKALQAAIMVNDEAAGAASASTEIEVLEHVRQVGPAYKEMVDDFCNSGIARVILGQTLTSRGSDGGGSRALGQVHQAVRMEKAVADSKALIMTVNQCLVWPLVLFNFGPNVTPPTWVIDYDPEADLSALSINLQRLWSMKLQLSKNYVYKTFQIPEPESEEDTLEMPANDSADGPGAPPDSGVDAAAKGADFSEGSHKEAQKTQKGGEAQKKTPGGGRRMADVKESASEAAKLEKGAVAEQRPIWRQLMTGLVDKLEALSEEQFALLNGKPLDPLLPAKAMNEVQNVLSEAALAAYLLGVDQIGWENRTALSGKQIQFAEAQSRLMDFGFDVAPKEAIEHFKKKKIVTRKTFDALEDEAKSGSFTVAGVYRKQVLQGFKGAITDALESGATQKETVTRFRQIIAGEAKQKMLGSYHLETIFRTNVQMSYGVGRRRSMESVADILPCWTYHAVGDDRTRPQHQALSGVTLKADNPFWNTHYPPWAFSCRCSVTADTDAPEGYNPVSPSEGVTIAYDEDGAPAKAEIGAQVVDFSPGEFVGVPAQGGLADVMKRGAESMKVE